LLESWTRSSSIRAGLAQRARIVLLAAEGVSNTEIAERVGVARQTVISWRERYTSSGVKGLTDEQRSGRPRTVDRAQILAATLTPPPKRLGITHWSSRLLADHLQVDASTVLRTWRHHRVQPWRAETFKFSTDPELVAKVTDVVGLYLNPPENVIVLSVDEKSQIQALDRTQKTLPMQPGIPESAPTTTSGTAQRRCSPPWRPPRVRSTGSAMRVTFLQTRWRSADLLMINFTSTRRPRLPLDPGPGKHEVWTKPTTTSGPAQVG